MIDFFGVSKIYPGDRRALSDLTVHVPAGQFVLLSGRSGAGKSTFLKLIYRGEKATTGQILVNGRNVGSLPRKKVPYLRRTMGIVFQDFSLIARRTVFDNVAFLLRISGVGRKLLQAKTSEALERVGLASHHDRYPHELSGGEQQRVAIARALINEPALLLADEPTGNLDPERSQEIAELFAEIHRKGTTVILATHDPALRRHVGERELVLDEGALVADTGLAGSTATAGRGMTAVPVA